MASGISVYINVLRENFKTAQARRSTETGASEEHEHVYTAQNGPVDKETGFVEPTAEWKTTDSAGLKTET
jgi:hypothetical protein